MFSCVDLFRAWMRISTSAHSTVADVVMCHTSHSLISLELFIFCTLPSSLIPECEQAQRLVQEHVQTDSQEARGYVLYTPPPPLLLTHTHTGENSSLSMSGTPEPIQQTDYC